MDPIPLLASEIALVPAGVLLGFRTASLSGVSLSCVPAARGSVSAGIKTRFLDLSPFLTTSAIPGRGN
jgi:hypothetical protein